MGVWAQCARSAAWMWLELSAGFGSEAQSEWTEMHLRIPPPREASGVHYGLMTGNSSCCCNTTTQVETFGLEIMGILDLLNENHPC